MIFPQPPSRVAEHVSRHDFILDALPPSGGLALGNGDVSASLCGGPDFLALGVSKRDAPVGKIVLRVHYPESGPHPPPLPERGALLPLPLPMLGERAGVATPAGATGWVEGRGVGEGFGPVTLRLYDATAHVSFPDGVTIEAFVAATRNLIVLRVRSSAPDCLPASLELSSPGSQFRADGPFRYARRDVGDLRLVICGFVYGARSHSTVREHAVVAAFDLPPSGECVVLAGVASSLDDPDPTRRARTEVERALPHGYLLLQREHAVSWERFWESAETEPPGALRKFFDCRERYALKSRRPHHDQTL